MELILGKKSAHTCVERIAEGLRRYVREMPGYKSLTIDEFAERITFVLLNEFNNIDAPLDTQQIIAASVAMNHACLQLISCMAATEPPHIYSPLPKEMVN